MAPFKCYSIFLTSADILPTIYLKAFIFGQFLPFMAGFYSHSSASDTRGSMCLYRSPELLASWFRVKQMTPMEWLLWTPEAWLENT